ncbi:hypothetical protein CROQUDRAFT_661659, partial [Cronartium quercuum f. sp. fusiforme G11]
ELKPQRFQPCRHPPLLHPNIPNPTNFKRNTMPSYSVDIKVQAIILIREGLTRAAVKRHLRSMEFIPSLCKIPGDGIGKEITNSVKEILEHTNAPIEFVLLLSL